MCGISAALIGGEVEGGVGSLHARLRVVRWKGGQVRVVLCGEVGTLGLWKGSFGSEWYLGGWHRGGQSRRWYIVVRTSNSAYLKEQIN